MIKQNNPGNIRFNSTQWQGLAVPPDHNGFCVFTDAIYGLRAMMIILAGYPAKHGVGDIIEMIRIWAPASDNNPDQNYVAYVAKASGFSADELINLTDPIVLCPIVKAMCEFENGPENVTYPDALYQQAAALALS